VTFAGVLKCIFSYSCAAVDKILTDTVPSLCDSWASCRRFLIARLLGIWHEPR